MNTKLLDKKLAAAIKATAKPAGSNANRAVHSEEWRGLHTHMRDIGLDGRVTNLLAEVFSTLGKPVNPNIADARFAIRGFLDHGLVETASVVFEQWKTLFRELPIDEVKLEAPDAKSLEVWRKVAGVRPEEMEAKLLFSPSSTYETSGADWLLARAKPVRSLPIARLFLQRQPRPKHLPIWSAAIENRLQHDKRGDFLGCIISATSENQIDLASLAEVVRFKKSLLLAVVDLLPGIASRGNEGSRVIEFVQAILQNVAESDGAEREFLTAVLVRLGSGMLMERQSGQVRGSLDFIQEIARRLRNITIDKELRARTWVLENLSEEKLPSDGRLQTTIDGARQIALAMEKAQQGFDAKDILAVIAHNVGMVPIGIKGEDVTFLPMRHQDIEGGMLPGDSAQIMEIGWLYGDDVVVRAKVKPKRN